jgi:chromosome segregation ATPase
MRLTLLLTLSLASAYSLGNGASPVQKVISMLQDMRAKGVQMKQEEQVSFAAYKQFCEDTSAEKKANIDDANGQIETLQADIQKAESDAAMLAEDIAELDDEIAKAQHDKAEAIRIREEEKGDFGKKHKDLSETIDALDRALVVLKKQDYDRAQAESLLQTVSVLARMNPKQKNVLAAFLATDDEVTAFQPGTLAGTGAGAAKGYEFQAGGIVEMLEDLKEKFEDERRKLEKDEVGSEHAFDLLCLDLDGTVERATKSRTAKASTKAAREEAAAQGKGDLSDTTASRDEDSAYLSALDAQCSQKSSDFESRQELRDEELEAIDKAIEIVSSPELAGAASKNLVPGSSAFSFALRGGALAPVQRQVAAFLEARASKLDSRVLSMMALKVGENPFAKVKKMIDEMITKLIEQANEEATHKGWCDTEMAKNTHTREAKTDEINTLTAKADKLTAAITRLAQEIADLQTAINEIDAAVAKAISVRTAETKKNKETVEDSQKAQAAVTAALNVLKDFYAKAAQATALVQTKQPEIDAPKTFEGSYTGMGDSTGGVVGLLEVIGSDFARLEAETNTAEDEASKEQDRFMAESKKDKAVKSADLDHKSKGKVSAESDLADTESDLKGTQSELDAAMVYYDKLKPSCQDATVTYDDRVSQREEEIASLKEALQILSN